MAFFLKKEFCKSQSCSYLFPLVEKLLDVDYSVGVDNVGLDPVALGNLQHFILDSQDGLSLCVCLR